MPLLPLVTGTGCLGIHQAAGIERGVLQRLGQACGLAAVLRHIGAGVAVAGAIGFVGLIVPHLIRHGWFDRNLTELIGSLLALRILPVQWIRWLTALLVLVVGVRLLAGV